MSLAERYKNLRCFNMGIGMESTLLPYQDWTAELLHLRSCTMSLLFPDIDFDMGFLMYFRYVMGLGLNIDSQGVCLLLEKDYGPDLKTHSSPEPLGNGWLTLKSGKRTRLRSRRTKQPYEREYQCLIVVQCFCVMFFLQSYAQDGKNWSDNACYVYRHN